MLKSFGETELTAPPGQASYRVLVERSLARFAYSARLDIRSDGSGRLTVGRAGLMDKSGPALRTGQVDIPAAEVVVVTRALAASPFEHISADGDLSHRYDCVDGGTNVFEAYVNQRYRYVMRGCAPDEGVVAAIATPLADLAIRHFPDWLLVKP